MTGANTIDDFEYGVVRMTVANAGEGMHRVGVLRGTCEYEQEIDRWSFAFTSPHELDLGHEGRWTSWQVDDLRGSMQLSIQLRLEGYGGVTAKGKNPEGLYEYQVEADQYPARRVQCAWA